MLCRSNARAKDVRPTQKYECSAVRSFRQGVCVCVCLHSPRDLLHITQADDIQVLYSSVVFAILGKGNNSVCTHLASLLIINRISYSLSKLVVCVYLLC